MKRIRAFFCAVALATATISTGASAQTPNPSFKSQLVGHWKLVSINVNGQTPYGSDPVGTLFLDAGGHYAIIVITSGGARSVAYFGGYIVDEARNSVTIHVEGSNDPTAVGHDQTRYVAFDKDELIVSGRQKGETPVGLVLTFRRDN